MVLPSGKVVLPNDFRKEQLEKKKIDGPRVMENYEALKEATDLSILKDGSNGGMQADLRMNNNKLTLVGKGTEDTDGTNIEGIREVAGTKYFISQYYRDGLTDVFNGFAQNITNTSQVQYSYKQNVAANVEFKTQGLAKFMYVDNLETIFGNPNVEGYVTSVWKGINGLGNLRKSGFYIKALKPVIITLEINKDQLILNTGASYAQVIRKVVKRDRSQAIEISRSLFFQQAIAGAPALASSITTRETLGTNELLYIQHFNMTATATQIAYPPFRGSLSLTIEPITTPTTP